MSTRTTAPEARLSHVLRVGMERVEDIAMKRKLAETFYDDPYLNDTEFVWIKNEIPEAAVEVVDYGGSWHGGGAMTRHRDAGRPPERLPWKADKKARALTQAAAWVQLYDATPEAERPSKQILGLLPPTNLLLNFLRNVPEATLEVFRDMHFAKIMARHYSRDDEYAPPRNNVLPARFDEDDEPRNLVLPADPRLDDYEPPRNLVLPADPRLDDHDAPPLYRSM